MPSMNSSSHYTKTVAGIYNYFAAKNISYTPTEMAENSCDKMQLNSGFEMPAIGFGTWGGPDSHELLAHSVNVALDAGYRSFDFAEKYGFLHMEE